MNSKIVVIKYGGAAQQIPSLIKAVVQDVIHLKQLGMDPVIVHGGGPEISKLSLQLGIVPAFINGLRNTDQATLEIAQMVLVGKINQNLVFLFNQEGGKAVGISGVDGSIIVAKQVDPALGFVGEVESVDPKIILTLIEAGYIPVIAPIASSCSQIYNINGDTVASAVAVALKADHLVFLTDVPGVLQDPLTKFDQLRSFEVAALIENGTIKGGMIPKIQGALSAIFGGVEQVHILDGREPHSLLAHFQGENQGTTIYV